MKIKDIYALKPIKEDREYIDNLRYFVPDCYDIDWEKNTRIVLKYYADYSFDGRRVWYLYSVWFDDKPVMVCQQSGRDADEYTKKFVTAPKLYVEMRAYIRSLSFVPEVEDVYSDNYDGKELTEFYDNRLESFYDPNFKPKHKVGDVITIKNTFKHPRGYSGSGDLIDVRVEILDVYDTPCRPYRARELDRVICFPMGEKPKKPLWVWKNECPDWKEQGYDTIYLTCDDEERVGN